jgi:hypothetical protein
MQVAEKTLSPTTRIAADVWDAFTTLAEQFPRRIAFVGIGAAFVGIGARSESVHGHIGP